MLSKMAADNIENAMVYDIDYENKYNVKVFCVQNIVAKTEDLRLHGP